MCASAATSIRPASRKIAAADSQTRSAPLRKKDTEPRTLCSRALAPPYSSGHPNGCIAGSKSDEEPSSGPHARRHPHQRRSLRHMDQHQAGTLSRRPRSAGHLLPRRGGERRCCRPRSGLPSRRRCRSPRRAPTVQLADSQTERMAPDDAHLPTTPTRADAEHLDVPECHGIEQAERLSKRCSASRARLSSR
jgi:hypothetical protein